MCICATRADKIKELESVIELNEKGYESWIDTNPAIAAAYKAQIENLVMQQLEVN